MGVGEEEEAMENAMDNAGIKKIRLSPQLDWQHVLRIYKGTYIRHASPKTSVCLDSKSMVAEMGSSRKVLESATRRGRLLSVDIIKAYFPSVCSQETRFPPADAA